MTQKVAVAPPRVDCSDSLQCRLRHVLLLLFVWMGSSFGQVAPDYRPNNGGVIGTRTSPEVARAGQVWEPVAWYHDDPRWGTLGWGATPDAACRAIRPVSDPPVFACPVPDEPGNFQCSYDCEVYGWLPLGRACKSFFGSVVRNSDQAVRRQVYPGDQCYCLEGLRLDPVTLLCQPAELQLVFGGASETRPAGTSGNATAGLTARVTSNGEPRSGVLVSFVSDVTSLSGGHDHHDVARPKGSVSPAGGLTDANGEVKVTFQAPGFAGIHTVTAACSDCSNSPAKREVRVRVPDLLPISPNPPKNPDGSYVYALTSVDRTHQGFGRYHLGQYYLTLNSNINLLSMIRAFADEGWGTVALNDASLFWGGRYDIQSDWTGSHNGHREGREIDVSFNRAGNNPSAAKRKAVYNKFCQDKKVSVPFTILHHYVAQPHFHVYLEKQRACWETER